MNTVYRATGRCLAPGCGWEPTGLTQREVDLEAEKHHMNTRHATVSTLSRYPVNTVGEPRTEAG